MRPSILILSLYIIGLCLPKSARSQSAVYPKPGTVFDRKLHSIQLWIHPDSLNQMLLKENWYSDHSYPALFVYDNEDTLHTVGLRLKGNTSRAAKKKGFRIDFDQFSQQTFQGLKKFNINGNHNDPSMSREYLAAHAMNQAYNPSIRGNLVRLYINGEYWGVRNNSEFIDKTFVQSRFGDNTGNLYKCSWPCDLTWKGANQQTYKDMMNGGERAYDLKTNETADDYSDLVNLINAINNSPTDSFIPRIERMFDVQAYLKTLAMEVLVGHWDNYFANKNNYWLYHNMKTGKFVYLPYDMDNTWGVQWGFSNIGNRNIHDWGNKAGSAAPSLTNCSPSHSTNACMNFTFVNTSKTHIKPIAYTKNWIISPHSSTPRFNPIHFTTANFSLIMVSPTTIGRAASPKLGGITSLGASNLSSGHARLLQNNR